MKRNYQKILLKVVIILLLLPIILSLFSKDNVVDAALNNNWIIDNITTNTRNQMDTLKIGHLTAEEEQVIIHKGTERPFTGKLLNENRHGIYYCRNCGSPLYRSEDKFNSGCGWPSFDDEIPGAIERKPDPDGLRTEIECAHCHAHLGHVFIGERLTKKDVRHCVNSISMQFVPTDSIKKAYFAGGCFWGVQYYLSKIKGVHHTLVGYMGGHTTNPSYEDVCTHKTGHLETVEVDYDPNLVSYEDLVKAFFEIHDFTQTNGQGPDIGPQYVSAIFVQNKNEEAIVKHIIDLLTKRHYKVATKILHDSIFYKAEAYHQNYYDHKGTKPYCHSRHKIFD